MTFKMLCVWDKRVLNYTHKKSPDEYTRGEEKTNQVIYWVRHNRHIIRTTCIQSIKKKTFVTFKNFFWRGECTLLKPEQHMVPFPSKITLVLFEEPSAAPFSGASGNPPSIQGWTSVPRWRIGFKSQRWALWSPWDSGYSRASLTPGCSRAWREAIGFPETSGNMIQL